MFSLAASTTVLALAVHAVSAGHSFSFVRRHHVSRATPPAGWATSYLEPYDTYHARYTADGCENKHNTTFFDSCCHPLLATETLAKNRPACCAVGATVACPGTVASSSLTEATSSSTEAATSSTKATKATSSSSAAAAKSTTTDNEDDDDEDCDDEDDGSGENDDNNDDDDDGEDCDDGDDEESSTPAATSTQVAVTHTTVAVTTTHAETTVKATPTSSTDKETTTTAKQDTTTAKQDTTTAKQQTTTAKETTTAKQTTTSTASTPDKTSSSSLVLGGFGTWFTQGGVAGACGTVHSDNDLVVALQTKTYANGANCGRKIEVINASNGKSVQGVVADECPTCTNSESVDMSLAMFEKLAALSVGEFSIKWQFLD